MDWKCDTSTVRSKLGEEYGIWNGKCVERDTVHPDRV